MTEQSTQPGVVPYVEWHTGARRILTIDLRNHGTFLSAMSVDRIVPTVGIDGRQYVVYWGRVFFEVPADRGVHVAVSLQDGVQASSLLIEPGEPGEGAYLDYVADFSSGRATLVRPAPQA